MPESFRSTGDAVRSDLVRGEGGGLQLLLASAKVGTRFDNGAGDIGESGRSQDMLVCVGIGDGDFLFNVGTECLICSLLKGELFQ